MTNTLDMRDKWSGTAYSALIDDVAMGSQGGWGVALTSRTLLSAIETRVQAR